jgi:hypothetical protein
MSESFAISGLGGVEESTARLPLVGYTVLWRLAGIRVGHAELEKLLTAAGFRRYLPDPPTPRTALRRALERWVAARRRAAATARTRLSAVPGAEDEAEGRRTLIRVINRAGSEHLVYALVAEDVDFPSLGLSYGTALRILLHKKTGEMVCTTEASGVIDALSESRRVSAELAPYWAEYKDLHIARDLSQMMREIVGGMSATCLRREGGVYFVPAGERESLGRLRELFARLPQLPEREPFVCALGVPDANETRRSLAVAVHAGVMDEIGLLRSDLVRVAEGGEKVREKTVEQRLLAYKRMRAKAELYRDLLGMRQGEVSAAVAALEAQARRLLMSDDEAGGPPGAPPSLFGRMEGQAAA